MTQAFVMVLRTLSAREDSQLAWLMALEDPRIGKAVDRMMARPSEAHSVGSLADVAGMSRSAFAERFLAQRERPLEELERRLVVPLVLPDGTDAREQTGPLPKSDVVHPVDDVAPTLEQRERPVELAAQRKKLGDVDLHGDLLVGNAGHPMCPAWAAALNWATAAAVGQTRPMPAGQSRKSETIHAKVIQRSGCPVLLSTPAPMSTAPSMVPRNRTTDSMRPPYRHPMPSAGRGHRGRATVVGSLRGGERMRLGWILALVWVPGVALAGPTAQGVRQMAVTIRDVMGFSF